MTEQHDVECKDDMMSETKKEEIPWLKSLIVFCNNVSVVGLSYVLNPSSSAIRRSIWFLLILAGALFTACQIQDRIQYFYRHPVNIIIRQEYEERMVFPTVTICNENQASLSKMTSIGTCCDVFILLGLCLLF